MSSSRDKTVAVIGLGFVGQQVLNLFLASGFRVLGIDIEPLLVDRLHKQFAEINSNRLSYPNSSQGYILTTDATVLAQADFVFICVPTPLEAGETQHIDIRNCACAFSLHGRSDALVILESTIKPGFVRELRPLLGHGGSVALAYAPERVDPQAIGTSWKLRDIPRLVAGVDTNSQERAATILQEVGIQAHLVELNVAEYAKLLENSYRLMNVAFINEFSALCREEGIDARSVITAASTKPFGYHSFWPGVGAGGHCVGIDPNFLLHRAHSLGLPLTVLESAIEANTQRPKSVAEALASQIGKSDTILAVGLTYKPGVSDIRDSAAISAVRTLLELKLRVIVFDALVDPPCDLQGVDLAKGLSDSTVVLLLVPQPEFVTQAILSSGLRLFDATGTLAGVKQI